MKRASRASVAWLLVVVGWAAGPVYAAPPPPTTGATAPPIASRTDLKLDSNLRKLIATRAAHADLRAAAKAHDVGVTGNRVGVDVYVTSGSAAVPALQALGMNVTGTTNLGPVPAVEGTVPIAALHAVGALSATKAVLPITGVGVDAVSPSGGGTDVSSAQGAIAHGVPQAVLLCNCNGAGVSVGVISDSIARVNGGADFNASRAAGNLPPNVTILQDGPAAATDEGRAMAELIYDEAPGLGNLFFQTGASPTAGMGPVAKTNAISNLTAHGVAVIADDVFYNTEPFFQDGMIAKAVDSAAAHGVAYYASAGNRGRQAYQATFNDDGGGLHNFGSGDTLQHITNVPAGGSLSVILQWAEPFGAATDSFAAGLWDATANGGAGAYCDTESNPTGFPLIALRCLNSTVAPHDLGIVIRRTGGSVAAPVMKYIAQGDFGTFPIATHPTGTGALNADASSARGAISVGAVQFNAPGHNIPEDFSSRGPTTHFFDAAGNPIAPDVRQKPEIAGADGINTDLNPASGLNPFFGTSAATPSIAGIAALARSANPTLSAAQVRAVTTNPANAIACSPDPAPADDNCGAGFLRADRAVAQALLLNPTVTGLAVSPSTLSGDGRRTHGRCVKPTRRNSRKQSCRRQVALTVSYRLTVDATLTVNVQGQAPGRSVHGACVAPTSQNNHHARCTRQVSVQGSPFTFTSGPGPHQLVVKGRLPAATYKVTATASNSGSSGPPQETTFTVVR